MKEQGTWVLASKSFLFTSLGGHQHLAIGQFTEIEDAMTAEYLVGHMQETLTERIEDIDAPTRTNPYRSALVTIQAVHLIA